VTDAEMMSRALALAGKGRYSVSPNPMVGCVIAQNGIVIGEGWHHRAGEPHAEIEALRACTADPRGATMYVTLEPCAHHGRTPPCADALVAARLARVVIAMTDPHEVVNGRGIDMLRAADIAVETDVCEEEARRLNEKFVHSVTHGMPFVLLKAGMTLDGKLATVTGESRWITSPAARERSLALREEYDAILVGGGTVAADDPQLTRRLGWNNSISPWTRVVLDRDRTVPPGARVLTDGGRTILYKDDLPLDEILRDLHRRGVQSLLIEGGSVVHSAFIRDRLWQKMIIFIAPAIVGGGDAPSIFSGDPVRRLTDAYRFRFDRVEVVGEDLMVTAYP
jgi:diaminohydroxyphosphoribosylaminopyrimidine deaminase/5-amino-6-(5-phosphoribosylamino)uracil reductase